MKQNRQGRVNSGCAAQCVRRVTFVMMALLLSLIGATLSAPVALHSAPLHAATADVLRAPYAWQAPQPATADILRGPYVFTAPAPQSSLADVLRTRTQ